jgi:RNA polymerase sigma factor (sigma-70 family)
VRGLEPFEAFYAREYRAMTALAYATSHSRLAAEDIAQEAFEAAFRDWERIGRLDNPATWVRRVVINRSVSAIRRRVSAARAMARVGGRVDRISLLPLLEETEHIWAAVKRLPKRQRQAIALRYVDELSLCEIGEVMDCSTATVNTHLRRGREALSRERTIQETS